MNLRLIAVEGPVEAHNHALESFPATIGRRRDNTICVADPAVSRRHCSIRVDDGALLVEDLNSYNGIVVNGRTVTRARLGLGDEFAVGPARFRVEQTDPSALPWITDQQQVEARWAPHPSEPEIALGRRAGDSDPELGTRALKALLELCAGLQQERTVEQIQARLLTSLLEVIPADRGTVLLADESADGFRSAGSLDRASGDGPFPVAREVALRALRNKESCLGQLRGPVPTDALSNAAESNDADSSESSRRILAVPAALAGRVVAVLYFEGPVDSEIEFQQRHIDYALAAGSAAAAALENVRRNQWLDQARAADGSEERLAALQGGSAAIERVRQAVRRFAPSMSCALITGGDGSGKAQVAAEIHRGSVHAAAPLATIRCDRLTAEQLESSLFGSDGQPGALDGGSDSTVLLQEVCDLPADLQARLAAELDAGREPSSGLPRLLSTSRQDLRSLTEQGRFVRGLYFRLSVLSIELPRLRERREDIVVLAAYYARRFFKRGEEAPLKAFSLQAREALMRYDWPANVRELANAVERACALCSADTIELDDLPEEVAAAADGEIGGYHQQVAEFKRNLLIDALNNSGGSYPDAAAELKVNRTYLHRLIRNLGLREYIDANLRTKAAHD